ncbi:MAG TPA: DNA/RNA non-specific endonuclease [Victivallales bacterium]|nr:DNA/RNA non-specific endonuclease [Victivallales bacterium]
MPRKPVSRRRSSTSAKSKIQSVKTSLLKRLRNYVILSAVMMFLGGAANGYKENIYQFVNGGYKTYIEKFLNNSNTAVNAPAAKKYNSSSINKKKYSTANSTSTNSSALRIANRRNTKSEIINHKYYMLGYNEDREQANWVAYKLTKNMVKNTTAPRRNDFRPDPLVKTGSATLDDYRGSGYDRGHLCPAAAMRFSKTAMSETFYMSNMSPQVPDFNRGAWKKLESKVRIWAVKNLEISVVTGHIFYNNRKHKEIGADKVDVPDAYFKVILDYRQPDIKAIGFILPNQKIEKPLYFYTVPVNNIERITGLDFFAYLPDNIEEQLESSSDYRRWI